MRLIKYFSFLSLVVVMFGCTKEVVEVCKKRHIQSVTVLSLPGGFDAFSDPDLRCDIATATSSYWSYPSYSADNVSGLPITISFPNQILVSKETWSMRLVDEDPIGEELIFIDDFNPYESDDGTMDFMKDGTLVLQLNYTESE